MKLKKDVADKINKCYNELREAGYQVSIPDISFETTAITTFGSAVPSHLLTNVSCDITIRLNEKDLELEK